MLLTPPRTASKIQPPNISSSTPGPAESPLVSGPVISSPVGVAQAAWSSPPISPKRQQTSLASIHSPCTPPGRPTTPHPLQSPCTVRLVDEKNMVKNDNIENMVQKSTHEEKNIKRKCILSLEVQEILKEEKVEFKKLVEAVRNDKMDFDTPQDDIDYSYSYNDLEYEDYSDEHWDDEIKNITDEDIEHKKPDEILNSQSSN